MTTVFTVLGLFVAVALAAVAGTWFIYRRVKKRLLNAIREASNALKTRG